MSKRNASPATIGTAVRLPPIPFKRVFKDANRYNRNRKHRKGWGE
jgi:hypothetical protein